MSMSGGLWSYNRFESYEKRLAEEKKALADKCDPKGKITRRDVIAAATGDCGNGKKVNEESLEEKKELPDFIKKKMDEKKGKKKDDDCECDHKDDKKKDVKEEALDEGSCGGKGYQMGGKVGYQKGGEVKPKKDKVVKEDVLEYMLENNLANNAVSAEVLFNHISDQFLESIEAEILTGE